MRELGYSIFLSYPGSSAVDSMNVIALGGALEAAGQRPWIAEREYEHLDDEAKAGIAPVLEEVGVFVSCVGTKAPGEWGRTELRRATERNRRDPSFRLCTVLMPGADPEKRWSLQFQVGEVFDFRRGIEDIEPLVSFLRDERRPEEEEEEEEQEELLSLVVEACRSGPGAVLLTGPPGSGKSSLAKRAAAALAGDFPKGQIVVSLTPGLSVRQALEKARDPVAGRGRSLTAYLSELASGPYLLIFDDVELKEATELVPPRPSAAIIVSRDQPTILADYRLIEVPPRRSRQGTGPRAEVQPGYTSDSPGGPDLLDVEGPVRALCSVIAAKEVEPPLSIALFGEWGAGKTFFIGQMKRRIEELADASSESGDSAYCSSIKQIFFNAWHYADANLWANLAGRVFEGLGDGAEGEAQQLYEKLASSKVQLRQAESEERAAKERAERAALEQEAAEGAVEDTRIELGDLPDSAADLLDEIDLEDPLLEDVKSTLRLSEPVDVAAVKDLLTARGAVAQLFAQAPRIAIPLVLLLLAAVGIAIFAPSVVAFAATLLPAVALILRLLAGPARWISAARAAAQERAEDLRRERNAQLELQLERSLQEEREARRRHLEARQEAEEAQHDIDEIKNGDKLFEFIAERSEATAYGAYQGVVALVRHDFEVLSRLIAEHTDEEGGLPRIERIVLYIDDLDRCPADRVVEVLEAVHLLMASELFVVVVAVDPRWLLSSLQRQLPESGTGLWAPTPEEYMEKIFQIPFSLPAMADDGYRRLIESLIPAAARPGDEDGVDPPAVPANDLTAPLGSVVGPAQTVPADLERAAAATAIELRPAGLEVTAAEIELLGRMRGLARTPRSAKRLANLYRLIRAALTAEELDALLGDGPGKAPQFPCVQLLLAIVVGFPSLAPRLCEEVARPGPARTWWDLVDSWQSTERGEAWDRLGLATASLRAEPLPPLDRFARWVPLVARYSYGALPVEAMAQPQ